MIIQTSHSLSKKINHSITIQTTNKHTQQPFNQRNKKKVQIQGMKQLTLLI